MELFITYTFLDSTLSFLSCLYQNRCDTISKKQGLPEKGLAGYGIMIG